MDKVVLDSIIYERESPTIWYSILGERRIKIHPRTAKGLERRYQSELETCLPEETEDGSNLS